MSDSATCQDCRADGCDRHSVRFEQRTAPSDLAPLITAVADQLSRIGTTPAPVEAERPGSAVPIRRSIQRDHLVCLVCGKPQTMLKRHLAARHQLSPTEYRERFGLKPDYPMTAPEYSQKRREAALAAGLGKRSARRREQAGA